MYSHVVHVCRPALRRWEMMGTDDRGRDLPIRGHQQMRVMIDQNLNDLAETNAQYADMETWYFEDKPTAESCARRFAREKPGRQVYVLELKNVYQATVGETVKMNYTEKGLVPV